MKQLLSIFIFLLIQFAAHGQPGWCSVEKPKNAPVTSGVSRIADNDQVLTIPVVVHIVLTQETVQPAYNPTDAQVMEVIRTLNDAFNATHQRYPDTLHGGVNTRIRFVMATRTPDCKPSNGIERFNASAYPQYRYNGSLENGLLEKIMWPDDEYFNILVVHRTPNNVAYGGFISGMSSFKGVVMPALWFLPNTGLIVHETGHFLNLYHTFTEGEVACPENTACAWQGDMICDTDPHRSSTTCDITSAINPCTGQPFGAVVKNFMSYSEVGCIDRFTPLQKARMRWSLLNYGYTLIDNENTRSVMMESMDADSDILIYPNPSSGRFYFVFKKPLSCNASVSVQSTDGRMMAAFTVKCMSNSLKVNLSNFPKGMYFLVVKDQTGAVTKKIVIQ